MKKIIISSLVYFIISNVNATGWLQPNSHWHNSRVTPANSLHEVHYKYENDTTINQKNYQLVRNSFSELFLFRTSNDSVFIIKDNGIESFVWHTNPQPGDIWVLKKDFTNIEWCVRIDTVIPEIINGQYTNWIYPTFFRRFGQQVDFTPFENYLTGYTKKINSVFGPIFNFRWTKYDPSEFVFFGQDEKLCLFESDSMNLYTHFNLLDSSEFINCGLIVTGIESPNNNYVEIYPNPTQDNFIINDDKNHHIKVVNLNGKILIDKFSYPTEPIDISNFTNGTYICIIDKKKIIKIIKK